MKLLILCAAAAATLAAQTMVEAGLGASRAATSAAPAAGVGKAVAGALSNLDKTLKSAEKTTSETVILPRDTKPATPAKTYEDIGKAEVGLAYDELLERFGPPAMQITGEDGIRKLTYGATKVQVKDGKVLAINAPKPAAKPDIQ
jgi:hypothetical protein